MNKDTVTEQTKQSKKYNCYADKQWSSLNRHSSGARIALGRVVYPEELLKIADNRKYISEVLFTTSSDFRPVQTIIEQT